MCGPQLTFLPMCCPYLAQVFVCSISRSTHVTHHRCKTKAPRVNENKANMVDVAGGKKKIVKVSLTGKQALTGSHPEVYREGAKI